MGEESYGELAQELAQTFEKADFAELVRVIDRGFGESTYSLRSLFRDEQRKVLRRILHGHLNEAGAAYRRIYEEHLPTMRFLSELGIPQPKAFQAAMDFLLNTDIRWDLEEEELAVEDIRSLLQEATLAAGCIWTWRESPTSSANAWRHGRPAACETPTSWPCSRSSTTWRTWQVRCRAPSTCGIPQNVYFELMKTQWPEALQRFQAGDAEAEEWLDVFVGAGRQAEDLRRGPQKKTP